MYSISSVLAPQNNRTNSRLIKLSWGISFFPYHRPDMERPLVSYWMRLFLLFPLFSIFLSEFHVGVPMHMRLFTGVCECSLRIMAIAASVANPSCTCGQSGLLQNTRFFSPLWGSGRALNDVRHDHHGQNTSSTSATTMVCFHPTLFDVIWCVPSNLCRSFRWLR